jgi:hypothetical protein
MQSGSRWRICRISALNRIASIADQNALTTAP